MKQPGVLKSDTNKDMFTYNSAIRNKNMKIWEMLGMLSL